MHKFFKWGRFSFCQISIVELSILSLTNGTQFQRRTHLAKLLVANICIGGEFIFSDTSCVQLLVCALG